MPAREGVLRLMDEARAEGLLVGVCSAATKSSAICVLESLLGKERFQVGNPGDVNLNLLLSQKPSRPSYARICRWPDVEI